jgi:hypothetical protein
MKEIAIYVRLSEVRPGEEAVSLDTQEADCRALAKRKSWKIAGVYKDAGRSAWSDSRDRPAFDRMLADLEAGKLGGIVAWKQDRLGRRVAEVAALLDKCRQLGAIVATGAARRPAPDARRVAARATTPRRGHGRRSVAPTHARCVGTSPRSRRGSTELRSPALGCPARGHRER